MARKILLADDSVTAQNMGRKILADAGYDVLTVNNGSAALKRVAESAPDLIILDVYMPGYSGLEVCQRLKDAAETAHIPVLLSVGKLEPFKPQEARRVRADAHIVKPFEASQLLTAIARLEDQMVPQQKLSRFATSSGVASLDESFPRPDESRNPGRGAKLPKKQGPGREASLAERGDPLTSGDSQLSTQAATFRDFRKKANSPIPDSPAGEYSSDSAAELVSHEPGPLAKLPGDITAEELSALSEVAARLNEPSPAAQSMPFSGKTSGETPATAPLQSAVEIADAHLEEEVARLPFVETAAPVPVAAGEIASAPAAEAPKPQSAESASPSMRPLRPSVKSFEVSAATKSAATKSAATKSAAAKKESEIPAPQLEPASNSEAGSEIAVASQDYRERSAPVESAQVESAQVESDQVESAQRESAQVESQKVEPARLESQTAESPQDPNVRLSDAVSAASFAQESAPVDRQDEPMFASMPATTFATMSAGARAEQPHAASSDAPSSARSVENLDLHNVDLHSVDRHSLDLYRDEKKEEVASIDSSFAPAAFAQSPSIESSSTQVSSTQAGSVAAPSSEPTSAEPATVAAAAAIGEGPEPDAPMPSDAALAEALRLLMPVTMQDEPAAQPAQTVSAPSQWFDNEETMELPAGRRWVAEALQLTPEEASMSLEAEMFRSFAASAQKIESLPVENPVAAIQLAVEQRLAAEVAHAPVPAELESVAATALKAMAAVAPAGVAPATSAETDIASIVDKVMADLRPKIVEEIARKLSGK